MCYVLTLGACTMAVSVLCLLCPVKPCHILSKQQSVLLFLLHAHRPQPSCSIRW